MISGFLFCTTGPFSKGVHHRRKEWFTLEGKNGPSYKERICSQREQILSLSRRKWATLPEFVSLESVSIPFKLNWLISAGCWDGVDATQYIGTVSVTTTGLTCQAWNVQTPWTHAFGDDADFPLDGTVDAAKNYCRSPNGDILPWCFAADASVKWEYCNITLCSGMLFILYHSIYDLFSRQQIDDCFSYISQKTGFDI